MKNALPTTNAPTTSTGMHISPTTIDLQGVLSALHAGAKVALLLRHSERPPIDHDDPEFGKDLPLTPRGIEWALALGHALHGLPDASFSASPMTRCRLTAHHIALGMGYANPIVHDADALGVHGFYYEDPLAVQKYMRQQGFMPYMLDYLNTGLAPHSRPIGPATQQLAAWLQQQTTAALGIYVSHDIFIASFLTYFQMRTFSAENWLGFLHGAALLHTPAMGWQCHAFAPNLIHPTIPTQFMR